MIVKQRCSSLAAVHISDSTTLTRIKISESWHDHGQLHRVGGAAETRWYHDIPDAVESCMWYHAGKVHADHGLSGIIYDKQQRITSSEWYKHNVRVTCQLHSSGYHEADSITKEFIWNML
jgi:hypothetical protein